jgi:hypothetical protein
MINSLICVGFMAMIVVVLDYAQLTDPNEEHLAYIFVGVFGFQVIFMISFIIVCYIARQKELTKLSITRHEVEVREYERLKGKVESKDEFLVHSYINDKIATELQDSSVRQVYAGVLRNEIQPAKAAGWLFDENDWVADDSKIVNLKPRIVKINKDKTPFKAKKVPMNETPTRIRLN